MKTPTLEEVRDHFENAKVIKSHSGINFKGFDQLHIENEKYYVCDKSGSYRTIWRKELGYAEIVEYKEPIKNTPEHYDNSTCTLYKIAESRNWSPYLFDIVKRLERSEKKGEFESDLNKSKVVIDLWLSEKDKDLKIR